MSRKGPAQSGHDAKPFDWHTWHKEQRDKRKAYLERERLRTQLKMPLSVPSKQICPDCGCRRGVKCARCNSTGFVNPPEQKISSEPMLEEQPSVPRTVECQRCYGVGKIANKWMQTRTCPDCKGEGMVNEAPD